MTEKMAIGHKLYRVTAFKIVGPYILYITFDDKSAQIKRARFMMVERTAE